MGSKREKKGGKKGGAGEKNLELFVDRDIVGDVRRAYKMAPVVIAGKSAARRPAANDAVGTGWKPAMEWLVVLSSGLVKQTRTAKSYAEAVAVAKDALERGWWAEAWVMEARRPL